MRENYSEKLNDKWEFILMPRVRAGVEESNILAARSELRHEELVSMGCLWVKRAGRRGPFSR